MDDFKNCPASAKFSMGCSIVFAILFFIGSLNLEYGYYEFLRVMLFIFIPIFIITYSSSFNYARIFTFEDFRSVPIFLNIIMYILFNPVAKFSFSSDVWKEIDKVCGFVQLFILVYIIYKHIIKYDDMQEELKGDKHD